jgi:DNA-binding response OmpR family regulator
LGPKSSVLIVDRSQESRAILRAALEQRGLQILEAAKAEEGLALARNHKPQVIVLDLESQDAGEEQLRTQFAAVDLDHQPNLVILGSVLRGWSGRGSEFIRKPYHYKPLILKIEALLQQASSASA